ncbi:MAG: beta strand repeat-containing protein, partial [Parvibaculales bacterium]
GSALVGSTGNANIFTAAASQAQSLAGAGGDDVYVISRHVLGNVSINDGLDNNRIVFDYGVSITQVKEFATSVFGTTIVNKVELTLGTGAVVTITSPASGRFSFQLGDGSVISSYAALKTALGASGSGSSTGAVLTMANDYAVTGSASVTAPSQAGAISESATTTGLGDVVALGTDTDLTAGAAGGDDYYIVTRFQYGDVDVTDGLDSNIVKFDYGVTVTQVKEFATSVFGTTIVNKVEVTLSTGAVVTVNSPASGRFAFQLGDDAPLATYAAFKTAIGASGSGTPNGTTLTLASNYTVAFPSSGNITITGTQAALSATLGDKILAADIIKSGAFTVTGAGDDAVYAIVKASDNSAVNWLRVDSAGNLRLADGAETVAPAGSHSLKLTVTEDGITSSSAAFTLNLGKTSYVGDPFSGLAWADWSNIPVFIDIDHDGDLDIYSGPVLRTTPSRGYYHNLLINGTNGSAGAWRKAEISEDPLSSFGVDSTGGQTGLTYDVNGDGLTDFLRFRYYVGNDGQTFIADGSGGYSNIGNFWRDLPVTDSHRPNPMPAKIDIDGDGDLDVVLTQSGYVYQAGKAGMRVLRRDSTGEADQSINVVAGDYLYGTIANGIVTVSAHSTAQSGKILLGRVNSNGTGLDASYNNFPGQSRPNPDDPKYGDPYTWWLLGGADQTISGGVLRVKANMSLFTDLAQAANPLYGIADIDNTFNPLAVTSGDIDGDGRREIVFTEAALGRPDVHLLKAFSTGTAAQSAAASQSDYLYGTVSNGNITLSASGTEQTGKILLGQVNNNSNGFVSTQGTEYTRSLLSIEAGTVTLKANALVFAEVTGSDNPFDAINAGSDGRIGTPNLLDLDGDGDLDLVLTQTNTATTIWWNTASGYSTTNDAAAYTAQNDTLIGRANAKDVLTGGAGNDVFVLDLTVNANGNYDVVTDFAAGDKIRVDISATYLNASNLANHNTGTQTNDANIKDVVITYLGADRVLGGTGVNADYVVMVLEDYTGALDLGIYELV